MANNTSAQPWDVPTYTPAEAGRFVDLSADRVRRWLLGYEYTYVAGPDEETRWSRKAPVVKRVEGENAPFATFLDLIDLLFVKRFLDHGVSLQKLRKALAEADGILGGHHFAQRSFFTDGNNVYMQVKREADALLELLSGGQWVIAPVIEATAQQIDFHESTGFAERWFPLGKEELVVLDPRIAFGAPTIVGRGVKTANVLDLYQGEQSNPEPVAGWMDLSLEEVGSAVRFEEQLRAA